MNTHHFHSQPYEHRGKFIVGLDSSDLNVLRFIITAFIEEHDPGLRKLMALKLMALINAEDVYAVSETLMNKGIRPFIELEKLDEALKWHLPY